MGSSRHELLDTMRTAHDWDAAGDPRVHLDALHAEAQERAVDAEALGMVHEEYIILAREAFWPKPYVEAVTGAPKTDDAYRADIGVRTVRTAPAYFGYEGLATALVGLLFATMRRHGHLFAKEVHLG